MEGWVCLVWRKWLNEGKGLLIIVEEFDEVLGYLEVLVDVVGSVFVVELI